MDELPFKLDDEIRSLLPPHTKDESERLEAELLAGMHVDKLVCARIGSEAHLILGDGYNRLEICQRHGLPFDYRVRKFPDRAAFIQWVIDNQLGRRNLTDELRAYYIGRKYLETRKNIGNPQLGNSCPIGKPAGSTAEQVAEQQGVSPRTVKNDAAFAEAVDELPEPEKKAVLNGQSQVPKATIAKGGKPFCKACAHRLEVGKPLIEGCEDCKELRKPKKAKPAKAVEEEPDDKPWLDEWGISITKEASAAFKDQEKFDELLSLLRKAKSLYKELANLPGGKYLQQSFVSANTRDGFRHNGLETCIKNVKDCRPTYTVCPYAYNEHEPHGKDCSFCKGLGWLCDVNLDCVSEKLIKAAKKANGAK